MAILSIEHVSKRFGSFTALDDVSLQVEQGMCIRDRRPPESFRRPLIKWFSHVLSRAFSPTQWHGPVSYTHLVTLGRSLANRGEL